MDYTSLVASLDGYATAAGTINSSEQKWTRQLVKIMETVPDSFDFNIDWTDVVDSLPSTTVDIDIEAADAIAKTLEILAGDSADAMRSVEEWRTVRPSRKRRGTGARESKDSDNPVWTLVTITDGNGKIVHTHSRSPGAISSLYYPVWEYLRDHNLSDKRDWDPVRKGMVAAIHAIETATFDIAGLTVTVSY